MKKKIFICAIGLLSSISVFSADPCFDGFLAETSTAGAEYYNETMAGGCNSNMCLVESHLNYQQSVSIALANMEDCCEDSDEISC